MANLHKIMSPKHATQDIKEKTKIIAPIAVLAVGFGLLAASGFLFLKWNQQNTDKNNKTAVTDNISEYVEGVANLFTANRINDLSNVRWFDRSFVY